MKERSVEWNGRKVTTWAQFHNRVKPGRKLLARLDSFPAAVLVAGCQRSGTTAVTRMLRQAPGVGHYDFGKDDELDAALLLSGYVDMPRTGRAVFQTTYLNDRVHEYFEHSDFRLVWVVREPSSVVYSMLYNWRRGALRRLYEACGKEAFEPSAGRGLFMSRFDKACASYAAKTLQTFELVERLSPDRLFVADYNDLVLRKEALMPRIFEFTGLPFRSEFLSALHSKSVRGASWGPDEARRIVEQCQPVYQRARALATGVSLG